MTQSHGHDVGGADAHLDCADARERLFEFLDGELDPEMEARMRVHLERCGHCFAEAGFERRFLETVRAARSAEVCPETLRARVRDALRREGWAEPTGS